MVALLRYHNSKNRLRSSRNWAYPLSMPLSPVMEAPGPLSPLATSQLRKWMLLKQHLSEWYASPDLQCLRACAALYTSHFNDEKPVWMFVLGPPSTGKTEIMINPFTGMSHAHTISSITESAFISNYNEKAGILPNLDKYNGILSGALFFPDFSNFLALDSKVRAALQAQMREIYDGSYQKHCGVRKDPIAWRGKISILAACTPELERYWGLENALGDRFLTIKLLPPDDGDLRPYLRKQQVFGKSKIVAKTKKLMESWLEDVVGTDDDDFDIPEDDFFGKLEELVDICIRLRQTVHRDFSKEITGIGTKDGPARFMTMGFNIAKQHARLFGLTKVGSQELKLVKRIFIDTCPQHRYSVIRLLLSTDEMITAKEIQANLPNLGSTKTIYRLIEDLEILQLIVTHWQDKKKYVALHPQFRERLILCDIPPLDAVLDLPATS